jgi:hypothetical protein
MTPWTDDEKETLLSCSIERVLNNALWLAGRGLNSRNAALSERAGTLIDDLEGMQNCKEIVEKLWREAAEAIRREGDTK